MLKLTYGLGLLRTQQGEIEGEGKCLTITQLKKPVPVGATATKWNPKEPQEVHDVILLFKNLEGARLLQDELNGLISEWSRELSVKIEDPLLLGPLT